MPSFSQYSHLSCLKYPSFPFYIHESWSGGIATAAQLSLKNMLLFLPGTGCLVNQHQRKYCSIDVFTHMVLGTARKQVEEGGVNSSLYTFLVSDNLHTTCQYTPSLHV